MCNLAKIKRVHLIGIGGAGMSSLAEVFLFKGYVVSGFDDIHTPVLDYLQNQGVLFDQKNSSTYLTQADLVIYSAAIRESHFQRIKAKQEQKKCIKRAKALGLLLENKISFAIAGIHGKTTTTLLCSHVFKHANQSPTVVAGGTMIGQQTGAKLGDSENIIVEADEYDRSFLQLSPTYSILLNLEEEHLDCYTDFASLEASFIQFVRQTEKKVFLNLDDLNLKNLLVKLPVELKEKIITFSSQSLADYYVTDIQYSEQGSTFNFHENFDSAIQNWKVGSPLFAEYNVSNILAVLAMTAYFKDKTSGFDFQQAIKSLRQFVGVSRRMESLGTIGKIHFYDDYAHHPEEIKKALTAIKYRFQNKRVVVVFQPHLYSRTQTFFKEFSQSLALADLVFLAPIFPAREQKIVGITSELIHQQMHQFPVSSQVFDDTQKLVKALVGELKANDVCLWMGAGDIRYTIGETVMSQIAKNND